MPHNLKAKLLARIPAAKRANDAPRSAVWLWTSTGALAACLLFVILLHYVHRVHQPSQPVSTPVSAGEELRLALDREEASARLLASTRILAEQAGTDEHVKNTLAYITQVYPETLAAREIIATNIEKGAR